MQDTVQTRAPAHLWIVGILSLLWNCFGGYDYTMSRMRNLDYLASMGGDPNTMLAYMDSMPIWVAFGWGLGVWAALLGSILLLMRSRYAVHAFIASLVGMVLSFGGQYLGPPQPPEGDFVVVEARGDNVTKAGQRYDNQYCMVWRLEGGRIRQIKEDCDSALVERVLGPFPAERKLAAG